MINRSINQSMCKSINKSMSTSINKSMYQTTEQPNNGSIIQRTKSQTINQAIDAKFFWWTLTSIMSYAIATSHEHEARKPFQERRKRRRHLESESFYKSPPRWQWSFYAAKSAPKCAAPTVTQPPTLPPHWDSSTTIARHDLPVHRP